MIEGLSHITLIVSDLERMTGLIETVFGGAEVYASGAKTFSLSPEKFFLVNGLWIAIMQGEGLPAKTYNHIAFKVSADSLPDYKQKILSLGLEVRESRPRVEGEGLSLYFYDYDNHLLELHTGTLEERLVAYQALGGALK